MIGSVLMETTIHLSHVIKRWRSALPDEIPREQTPVVLLCGGEGLLLSMLLRPNHANLFETSPEIQDFLASGEMIETVEQWKGPTTANRAFQMVHHRPAIHDGVQNILVSQQAAVAVETEVNILRDELVGQRIAVVFRDFDERGTIVSVRRSVDGTNEDDTRKDTFSVFVNNKNAFMEVSFKQVVGTFSCEQFGEKHALANIS
jgi:hypothetical protein